MLALVVRSSRLLFRQSRSARGASSLLVPRPMFPLIPSGCPVPANLRGVRWVVRRRKVRQWKHHNPASMVDRSRAVWSCYRFVMFVVLVVLRRTVASFVGWSRFGLFVGPGPTTVSRNTNEQDQCHRRRGDGRSERAPGYPRSVGHFSQADPGSILTSVEVVSPNMPRGPIRLPSTTRRDHGARWLLGARSIKMRRHRPNVVAAFVYCELHPQKSSLGQGGRCEVWECDLSPRSLTALVVSLS